MEGMEPLPKSTPGPTNETGHQQQRLTGSIKSITSASLSFFSLIRRFSHTHRTQIITNKQTQFGAIDPDFPDECADADASISGISFYTGACLHVWVVGCVYVWGCGDRGTLPPPLGLHAT